MQAVMDSGDHANTLTVKGYSVLDRLSNFRLLRDKISETVSTEILDPVDEFTASAYVCRYDECMEENANAHPHAPDGRRSG
jgi:hypothetical protein